MASRTSAASGFENVQRIEPATLEGATTAIADVIAELSAESAALGQALHPRTAASLAQLVPIMNAYERTRLTPIFPDHG